MTKATAYYLTDRHSKKQYHQAIKNIPYAKGYPRKQKLIEVSNNWIGGSRIVIFDPNGVILDKEDKELDNQTNTDYPIIFYPRQTCISTRFHFYKTTYNNSFPYRHHIPALGTHACRVYRYENSCPT